MALGARQFPSFDCTEEGQASDDNDEKNEGNNICKAEEVKNSLAPTTSGELRVYHVSQ